MSIAAAENGATNDITVVATLGAVPCIPVTVVVVDVTIGIVVIAGAIAGGGTGAAGTVTTDVAGGIAIVGAGPRAGVGAASVCMDTPIEVIVVAAFAGDGKEAVDYVAIAW